MFNCGKLSIAQRAKVQRKKSSVVSLSNAEKMRTLCILLTPQAVVSYRSILRILELFKQKTAFISNGIPHFTSVINWNLRVGLAREEKAIKRGQY